MGYCDMTGWPQVAYTYDGSFNGFLTCVYESYVHRERAAAFSAPGQAQLSLYPERPVDTHPDHARRVRLSLPRRLSPQGARLVVYGFLTALPEREQSLYDFLALGFERGPSVLHDLTDERVFTLDRAVRYLTGEAHLLKGFVRFSDQSGVLTAETRPLALYEGDTQVGAVVRALEAGPEAEELTAALPAGFRPRGVWLEEKLCYVNLSSRLLKQLPEDARLDTALEALARSLCSLDAVAETRFLVDGEFAAFYGPVDISEPFAYPEAPAG